MRRIFTRGAAAFSLIGAASLTLAEGTAAVREPATAIKPLAGPILRYLALGDSYTIGESVERGGAWPHQLADALCGGKLAAGAKELRAEVEIIARTGWTTAELSAAIDRREHDASPLKGPFHLVTLLIGVNDQYRGGSPQAYRPAFAALLGRAIGFAAGNPRRVIVLSIPDWSVTPFARGSGRNLVEVAQQIRLFNEVNREESRRAGARYVDITPESMEALNRSELLASDGLHPSRVMYAEWVHLILPEALAILGQSQAGAGGK